MPRLKFISNHINHSIKSCFVGSLCFALIMAYFEVAVNWEFYKMLTFLLYLPVILFLSITLAILLIFVNALFRRHLIGTPEHKLFLSFVVTIFVIGFHYLAVKNAGLGEFNVQFIAVMVYIIGVIGGIWYFQFERDEEVSVVEDEDVLDKPF